MARGGGKENHSAGVLKRKKKEETRGRALIGRLRGPITFFALAVLPRRSTEKRDEEVYILHDIVTVLLLGVGTCVQ